MAWTAPTTRSTGELITASIWNTDLVDNLVMLKDPPSENYEADEGSDYTTTSTSFTDVDAGTGANTKFRRDITTFGGDVMVSFHGSLTANGGASTNRVWFDVSLDGSQVGGDGGFLAIHAFSTLAVKIPFSFVRLITGLAAASHTFKLQWKVTSGVTATLDAGAGTANGDIHPQFWVREVS